MANREDVCRCGHARADHVYMLGDVCAKCSLVNTPTRPMCRGWWPVSQTPLRDLANALKDAR